MQNLIKVEKINKLTKEIFEDIYNIEKLSFNDPWTENMFRVGDNESIIVAKINEKIEGYICYMTVIDECHILNVAVNPESRGQGIASKLLENLISKNKSLFYYLEVKINNANAIRLYEKHNFEKIGIRPKYYQNGEDALIMMKDISKVAKNLT